jgi:hypothetical protein
MKLKVRKPRLDFRELALPKGIDEVVERVLERRLGEEGVALGRVSHVFSFLF